MQIQECLLPEGFPKFKTLEKFSRDSQRQGVLHLSVGHPEPRIIAAEMGLPEK